MANRLKYLIFLLGAGMLLHACSDLNAKEIGRIPVNEYNPANLGYRSLHIQLKKGDKIALWSEMDMEYDGSVQMSLSVDMTLDDKPYQSLELNPFEKSITVNETKTISGKHTQWRFSGKNEEIEIKESGRYKFVAVLKTSFNPTLRMKQPQLILKRKK